MKPGGHIVIQGSLGEHCYTVGSSMFPAMTADKGDLISECIFNLFQSSKTCTKSLFLTFWNKKRKRVEDSYFEIFYWGYELKLNYLPRLSHLFSRLGVWNISRITTWHP